jgi:putative AlgH/UPF0301 family transcriptional regulator
MAPRWKILKVLVCGMTLVTGIVPAQSRKIEDLGARRLLVMEPQKPDPVFAESVILLIHYGTDGVVGLRLNQPSRLPLSRLREVKGTAKRSDLAYVGGTVEIEGITALVRAPSAPRDAMHVAADIYAVQSKNSLEAALEASKGPADCVCTLGTAAGLFPNYKTK